jgi:hypothetical protein
MTLKGQSTLTEAEKVTETVKHLQALVPHTEQMNQQERDFVLRLASYVRLNTPFTVTNPQLFWLRDLRMKY